jgi:hypothetical protein
MTLREKQSLFARLLAQLILFVYQRPGWELTLGEGHNDARVGHMRGSLHYVRLAQDLNLFVNGEYVSKGGHPAWREIGEQWESMHELCRWGGRFKDDNHLSLEHEGKA